MAGATSSAVDESVSETHGGLLAPVLLAARVTERTPAQLQDRPAQQSKLKDTMIVKWQALHDTAKHASLCMRVESRTVSKADGFAGEVVPTQIYAPIYLQPQHLFHCCILISF